MTRCCDITGSMLRERIEIQRKTRSADGYGGFTESWAADPTGTIAASVRPLTGTEALAAMRMNQRVNYRVIIRFRGDGNGGPYYNTSDRIFWRGRYHNIISVFDVESKSQWIEMLMVEGQPS